MGKMIWKKKWAEAPLFFPNRIFSVTDYNSSLISRNSNEDWGGHLYTRTWHPLFVHDGILFVADYNSTLMGVVVVNLFHDGITRERLELSSCFFAW